MSHPAPAPLVFTHIPKTAGSTIYNLLRRNYGGGFAQAYGPQRERLAAELSAVSPGGPITCIAGHQPIGTYSEGFHHLIIFRNPAARIRSLYGFLRRNAERYPPTEARPSMQAAARHSLAGYIEADPLSTHNAQVRFAAGGHEPVGPSDSGSLERAIDNLSQPHVVVGVVEQLAESIFLAGRELRWRKRYYVPENVAPASSERASAGDSRCASEVPAPASMRAATTLDDQLVEWASRDLLARAAQLTATEQRELRRFRRRLRLIADVSRRVPAGRVRSGLERRLP